MCLYARYDLHQSNFQPYIISLIFRLIIPSRTDPVGNRSMLWMNKVILALVRLREVKITQLCFSNNQSMVINLSGIISWRIQLRLLKRKFLPRGLKSLQLITRWTRIMLVVVHMAKQKSESLDCQRSTRLQNHRHPGCSMPHHG